MGKFSPTRVLPMAHGLKQQPPSLVMVHLCSAFTLTAINLQPLLQARRRHQRHRHLSFHHLYPQQPVQRALLGHLRRQAMYQAGYLQEQRLVLELELQLAVLGYYLVTIPSLYRSPSRFSLCPIGKLESQTSFVSFRKIRAPNMRMKNKY